MKKANLLLAQPVLLLIVLLQLCLGQSCESQAYQVHGDGFAYALDQPTKEYILPGRLREVSGLTWIGPGMLGLIQDERADWYQYDLQKEEVVLERDFGKNGDFEGIELIGDQLWAVRSDGRLYQFALNSAKPEAQVHKTALDEDNDVEGLGYWPARGQLLLACKGEGSQPASGKVRGKAIYTFDVDKQQLSEQPLFTITDPAMAGFLGKDTDRAVTFNPSAIAWHPLEDAFYIVSTAGKKLVVVDKNFKISHLIYLDEKVLKQPEGICFAPDGTMYISSEGRQGKGYIVQFEYQSPEN